jgi:hypothetical protein
MAGLGLSPLGTAPYGLGTPLVAPISAGSALEDDEGVPQASRFIDPITRRYVFDDNGRLTGMGATQQRVQLAFSTKRRSSVLSTMGESITSIQDITDDLQRRVETEVASTLSRLVNEKALAILSVTITPFAASGRKILVRWRDLTTGTEQQTAI